MKKIIFIGFNKTATTSIHRTFCANKFNCVHRAGAWRFKNRYIKLKKVIERRDVISDWGDTHLSSNILQKIINDFDDVLFVLNTRKLKDWIKSRFKHYYFNKKWDFDDRLFSINDVTLENAEMFIYQREIFYANVAELFQNKSNLLVLDIYQNNFYERISGEMGIQIKSKNLKSNVRKDDIFLLDFQEKIEHIWTELEKKHEYNLKSVLSSTDEINKKLCKHKNNIV